VESSDTLPSWPGSFLSEVSRSRHNQVCKFARNLPATNPAPVRAKAQQSDSD